MAVNKAKNCIFPVWQPVGVSTNRLSQIIGEHFGVVSSHTGTLDPMAEGVVIILLGDEHVNKYDYAKWKKTYEFEILFGISTVSYDGMGFITKDHKVDVNKSALESIPALFKGDYTQKVPPYSAVKYKGKKLFEHAKLNSLPLELPEKKGKIFELSFLGYREIRTSELVENIISRIKKVKGDFCQQELITQWQDFITRLDKNRTSGLAKFSVTMSKGMYVRSLSQDICRKLLVNGLTFSIKRVKNGIYGEKECAKTADLFGSENNFHDLISGIKP